VTTKGAPGYQRFGELAPDVLALLRERARAVAQQPAAATQAGEEMEVLELRSRGQRFLVPLAAVEGVVELTSLATLPRPPPAVRGLVSFRGEVLVGVELALLAGGGAGGGMADLRRVVALAAEGRRLALLTESGLLARSVPLASFGAMAGQALPFVVGTDASFASLVEPAALIAYAFEGMGRSGA
jgi:hypothetical protein